MAKTRISPAVIFNLVERYAAGGLIAVSADLQRHGLTPEFIRHAKHKHAPHARDHRRRVTHARRHELLQIYLHMGRDEARRECVESGVRDTYAETIAHDMGLYLHQTRG
jgi:hypothetical protein